MSPHQQNMFTNAASSEIIGISFKNLVGISHLLEAAFIQTGRPHSYLPVTNGFGPLANGP